MKLLNKQEILTTLPECEIISYYVYFLIKDNEIVYVGKTKSLSSRVLQHTKNKDFDTVRILKTTSEDLDMLEGLYIHQLKPKFNKSGRSFNIKNEVNTKPIFLNPESVKMISILSEISENEASNFLRFMEVNEFQDTH